MKLFVLYYDYAEDDLFSVFVVSLQAFIELVCSSVKNVVAVYDYVLDKGWASNPKLYNHLINCVNYDKARS